MKSNLGLKITLLALAFLTAADFVIIPASAEIFATFANEDPAILNMVLTGSLFTAMVGALVSGVLAKRVCKKYILIGAQIIFIVGALFGAVFENIYYMVIMRLLVGLGYGSGGAITLSFITELFKDEKERGALIGGYNGATAAFGIAASLIAGFLAVANWHYAFLVYAVGIPILVMSFIFLPKTEPESEIVQEEAALTGSRKRFSWVKLGTVAIAALVFECLYCITSYFLAIFLAEIGIGDAATAGMYTSLVSIGQFLSGFMFAFVFMRMRRAMPVLLFGVMGLAYLGMYVFPNAGVIGAAVTVLGCLVGLGMSYYQMHVEEVVPASSISLAMAVIMSAFYIGGFLASYAVIGYQAMLGVDTIAPIFLPVAITALVCSGIALVLAIRACPRIR